MYAMMLVTAFMTLNALIVSVWANATAAENTHAYYAAEAGHIAMYANLIGDYVRQHPGFNGTVTDAQANFPTWYHRVTGEANVVAGNTVYAYFPAPTIAASMRIARLIGGGVSGVNHNGRFELPGAGDTAITLPASIPNYAVVVIVN